jgi:hypothetical protein
VYGEVTSDIGGAPKRSLPIVEDCLDGACPPIGDLLVVPVHAHDHAVGVIRGEGFSQESSEPTGSTD